MGALLGGGGAEAGVVAGRWVAEVRIALDAWAGSYRGKRCIKCGSTDVRVAQSGLWDGFDATGARTGGIFWYGECHACRCRMAGEDDDCPAREVEEEEWIHTICAPYEGERRRLLGHEGWPTTVEEAVERLIGEMTGDERDLLRGMPSDEYLSEFQMGLGLGIRNEFGLWRGNGALLKECEVALGDPLGAEKASLFILSALRERLIETASEGGMARARARWGAHVAERERRMDERARRDEGITSRRCPACGRACPRYRETCRYCGVVVGRERV